jgi:vitamin B12 transporter
MTASAASMRFSSLLVFPALSASLCAQTGAVSLPAVTVVSSSVANQSPSGTFSSPVSALRYEPRIDLAGRNLAEAQADVTLRGGIFENTGIRLGALSLSDPQTGHYLTELPVAPAMLGAPEILTGVDHALVSSNSTVGAIGYEWRPVEAAGLLSISAGQNGYNRQEFYQGYAVNREGTGRRWATDVSWARSESDGAVPFGEHDFERLTARLQVADTRSQTDLVLGYQTKFFGWPNLYTPFNSNETENLQTLLLLLNHRTALGEGDFAEAGAWHRRNKDDYAFNRFAALGPVHPFQHTTWAHGAAVGLRRTVGAFVVNLRGEVSADYIKSTSLIAGKYRSRTLVRYVVVPEKSWVLAGQDRVVVKAGAAYDDSNRSAGAVSPMGEIARESSTGLFRRIYASFAETTQLPSYTALNSSATAGLFRGNPALDRARSCNFEIGIRVNAAGWTGQAAVFSRRDVGLVDWTFRRGVTARAANAVDVETAGIEIVARRSWSALDLVLGHTALTKDPDYRGAAVDASFYALNYARHRFTAAVTARLGQGFELRLDNVARVQADNLLRVVGGSRALTSALGVHYRPPVWRTVALSIQTDNLWNTPFQEVPAVPAAGRMWSGGFTLVW